MDIDVDSSGETGQALPAETPNTQQQTQQTKEQRENILDPPQTNSPKEPPHPHHHHHQHQHQHQPRRRNRPALSCIQCRSRKIKCDRGEPCNSCIKSKIVNCAYEEARRPKPRVWRLSPGPSASPGHDGHDTHASPAYRGPRGTSPSPIVQGADRPYNSFLPIDTVYRERRPHDSLSGAAYASSATSLTISAKTSDAASVPSPAGHLAVEGGATGPASSSLSSGNNTEAALAERVRLLEQQLADAKQQSSTSHRGDSPSNEHGVISKTRYFGASHFMNIVRFFPTIIEVLRRLEKERTSEAWSLLLKCKVIGRAIKAKRLPVRPSFDIGSAMPAQATCHRLVDAYFRNFETAFRILHGPTFWQEYHRYWENPASVGQAFVIQLQLCMAIGICFQDDSIVLRSSAIHWVYEAQYWLVSPSEKSRMNISGLQIMCLSHLARETVGVGGDLIWISAGALLRTAMYMGLHRDPEALPRMSTYRAEIRRRLWATILELELQSSIDSGGPPLISPADFDTRPPSNYDDDQISEEQEMAPQPRPLGSFTQTTVQLALLRSFPTRLAIANFVNSFRSVMSYQETLKWNEELTIACRTLSAMLSPAYDPAGVIPKRLSQFHLRLAEHLVHRFYLALNHPWLWSAQNNPAYYFARKMCVETSMKLFRALSTEPPGSSFGTGLGTGGQLDDWSRLALCGFGPFRVVPQISTVTIALELLLQVQEDQSIRKRMNLEGRLGRMPGDQEVMATATAAVSSGVVPRPELLEALKTAVLWQFWRLRLGEVNVKGYAALTALLTECNAIQRGASEADISREVEDSITEALKEAWDVLKEINGESTTPASLNMDLGLASDTNPFDDPGLGWGLGGEWDWEALVQQNPSGFNLFPTLNDFNQPEIVFGPG